MSLSSHGERGILDTIRRRFRGLVPPSPAGIGDDAAVIRLARDSLVTTDTLVEDHDFRRDEPAYLLGRKALAVNMSDLAAMGGAPTAFLLTLVLPPSLRARWIDDLLHGCASRAREARVQLIGGDLSGSPGPIAIAITLFGRPARGRRPITRAGARPGDAIWISGPVGAAAAGRRLLDRGWRAGMSGRRLARAVPPRRVRAGRAVRTHAREAIARQLDPVPRGALGRLLALKRIASAAIDVSDGIAIDLHRLAEASGVGARLLEAAIPIAGCARALAAEGLFSADLAIRGGEDFEILFTVPPRREKDAARLDAVPIGRIVPKRRGVTLVAPDGRALPLAARGFDHFGA